MGELRIYRPSHPREPVTFTSSGSTAFSAPCWVVREGTTNTVVPCAADAQVITGLCLTTLTATQAAAGTAVEVLIPLPGDMFIGPRAQTGADADCGGFAALTDSKTVNNAAVAAAATKYICGIHGYLDDAAGNEEIIYSISSTAVTVPGGTMYVA